MLTALLFQFSTFPIVLSCKHANELAALALRCAALALHGTALAVIFWHPPPKCQSENPVQMNNYWSALCDKASFRAHFLFTSSGLAHGLTGLTFLTTN